MNNGKETKKKNQHIPTETTMPATQAKQETAVAAIPEDWGNDTVIDQSERLIPKLHLMQGQSKLVAEEKAKMGDIVNLVTGEVLGGSKEPVEIIPLKKLPSTWVIYTREANATERVFKEIVNVEPANADWEWTEKNAQGQIVRENDYCINFLVIAAKDPTIPFVVSFKRTSVKAGKKVVNHFDRCRIDKCSPARYALKMTSTKLMNKDQKPFFVLDILPEKRQSTAQEFETAYKWFLTFKDKELKVDNSDVQDDVRAADAGLAPGEVKESSQY